MSMAMAIYGHLGHSVALSQLADMVNMKKDTDALVNMKGARLEDIDWCADYAVRFIEYAKSDVDVCLALFHKMIKDGFPIRELKIIDILMRMYIDSRMQLNAEILANHLDMIYEETKLKVEATGYLAGRLRSRTGFANILEDNGYTAPVKISPRTKKETYAFNKTDPEFSAMLNSPDLRLRALCEGRVAVATSIERTRTERFADIYGTTPEHTLAVPLKYSGAHTHRFSGQDSLNLQNLGVTSPLRKAISAPDGYLLVVADASQIEARILAYLAGEYELCSTFGRGEDVYANFAADVYGYAVNKNDQPEERKVGKTGILGLGFGAGPPKFQWMLQAMAKVEEDSSFCQAVVKKYRNAYPGIPAFWREGDRALIAMISQQNRPATYGPCELGDTHMVLPTGMKLEYPGLAISADGMEYCHPKYGAGHSIWGGTITENVVQALDHVTITETMLHMQKNHPTWHCALQMHDEVVYVTPEDEAEHCLKVLLESLARTPFWADSRLQLGAEGTVVKRYGDAK
jgi:DNA polymerase